MSDFGTVEQAFSSFKDELSSYEESVKAECDKIKADADEYAAKVRSDADAYNSEVKACLERILGLMASFGKEYKTLSGLVGGKNDGGADDATVRKPAEVAAETAETPEETVTMASPAEQPAAQAVRLVTAVLAAEPQQQYPSELPLLVLQRDSRQQSPVQPWTHSSQQVSSQ